MVDETNASKRRNPTAEHERTLECFLWLIEGPLKDRLLLESLLGFGREPIFKARYRLSEQARAAGWSEADVGTALGCLK